ncbi:MAG: hypothetical protein GY896_06125 [Gammaproteobacteria bacterium]|nr:hypothetical protein [Gammaproteobacteria bacterium]
MKRSGLHRLTHYFGLIFGAAILYVLLDFMIDLRPANVHSSYRFNIEGLVLDQARILRQDNLSVLVIKRSIETINRLKQGTVNLQDPESRRSHQPVFATNLLRSMKAEYFISYAIGTDFGCTLEVFEHSLGESCGKARYDFAGRALKGENKFQNLAIPDYTFTNNFNTLTIRP